MKYQEPILECECFEKKDIITLSLFENGDDGKLPGTGLLPSQEENY